jgi:excisionase family DNA binding protein
MKSTAEPNPVALSALQSVEAQLSAGIYPVLLTVDQVMAKLQLSWPTVYRLIQSRKLASVCIGRSRRIPVSALDKYLSDLAEGRIS